MARESWPRPVLERMNTAGPRALAGRDDPARNSPQAGMQLMHALVMCVRTPDNAMTWGHEPPVAIRSTSRGCCVWRPLPQLTRWRRRVGVIGYGVPREDTSLSVTPHGPVHVLRMLGVALRPPTVQGPELLDVRTNFRMTVHPRSASGAR